MLLLSQHLLLQLHALRCRCFATTMVAQLRPQDCQDDPCFPRTSAAEVVVLQQRWAAMGQWMGSICPHPGVP